MPTASIGRVTYKNNPLTTVICQVRFPTILRIDTEIPSAFQENLRPQYIELSEGREFVFDIRIGNTPNVPADDIKPLNTETIKNYEFASEDNSWKVNLTRNFLSLSTTNYYRWEEFRSNFEFALNAFVSVYKPVMFTRIGLRYRDIIVRSKLKMNSVDWVELINSPFLGILASPPLKESVKHYQATVVMGIEDNQSEVRVSTGIVKSAESEETCFLVDSDYYDLKKRKTEELLSRLDFFHSKAYELFRSCITEKLHKGMNPQERQ